MNQFSIIFLLFLAQCASPPENLIRCSVHTLLQREGEPTYQVYYNDSLILSGRFQSNVADAYKSAAAPRNPRARFNKQETMRFSCQSLHIDSTFEIRSSVSRIIFDLIQDPDCRARSLSDACPVELMVSEFGRSQ